jgi:hypothetical protein
MLAPLPATAAAPGRTRIEIENEDCIGCHREEAAEWGASLHRSAFRDASFQAGYARDRDAAHDGFCRGCHAPAAAAEREPPAWEADHGVTCTSCHGLSDEEAHAGLARARASCNGCHEFAFEGALLPPRRSAMMQLTVTEHRESAAADRQCASCHMARTGARASHRFDVSRNPAFLRGALATVVKRTSIGVDVLLSPRDVGHAFPTGDMFRRVIVRAEVLGLENEVVVVRERVFGRTFTLGPTTKETARDTRLVGETRAHFAFGSLRPARVRVRVLYQRLISAALVVGAHASRDADAVEDTIVLADETLVDDSRQAR